MERSRIFSPEIFEKKAKKIHRRRTTTSLLISKVFPHVLVPDSSDPSDVQEFVADGYGLVLLYNHFSKSDHLRAVGVTLEAVPDLASRRILSPVAVHQYDSKLRLFGNLSWVQLKPIITEDTRALQKDGKEASEEDPKESRRRAYEMYSDYIATAQEVLSDGGIVALAPQAGRREKLGESPGKVVDHLLRKYGNEKVVFVFVGLGVFGAEEYISEDVGGYNVRKLYTIKFGKPLTRQQLEEEADGKGTTTDTTVFEKLAQVVPPEYL